MQGLRAAVMGLALVAAVGGCAATMAPDRPRLVGGLVRFTYQASSAKTVSVVGAFNGWAKGATPMTNAGGAGGWVVEVPLRPGEYPFMYLVDGTQWVVPPLAEDFVTDGFGQTNGVVIVR